MRHRSTLLLLFAGIFICPLSSLAAQGRVMHVENSSQTVTVSAVLDANLDLAGRLLREGQRIDSPVPLAPPIVAGQGPDAANLTFVRVLNQYGISTAQFLAYPPRVTGGVDVAAGLDADGEVFIATAPIQERSAMKLRLFDGLGGLRSELEIAPAIRAPYVIATGDFLATNRGYEIAVAAAYQSQGQSSGVVLYDADGNYLKAIRFTAPASGRVRLEGYTLDGVGHLEMFFPESGHWLHFDPDGEQHGFKRVSVEEAVDGVYRSAYGSDRYWAAVPGDSLSEVVAIAPDNSQVRLNVGRLENEFWITGDKFGFDLSDEGEFIKFVDYGHIRTDASSPAYRNYSLLASEDPQDWAAATRLAERGIGRLNQPLSQQKRVLWEPTFTHRQFNDRFDAWKAQMDEATGLPRYLMLSRNNEISYYGEFGATDSFVGSTYAPGLPALDRLYLLPLRAFLFSLSRAHREAPERVISVEPNHEHEIAVRESRSVGDYNPAMILGFKQYLMDLLGADFPKALAAAGGPAPEVFDAPRGNDRGSWDAYDTSNRYFNHWVYFNRYVVNRRLADTFTQALLAGFPPEIIKSHQIPDAYAIGTLDLFSQRMPRITPIDYALTAGVGFGFTRYSVWFKRPTYAFRAAYTSGFDSMVFGEYQALTSNQKLANEQFVHVWSKGGNAIHAMQWPASHDRGFNETMRGAIQNLLDHHDVPRPGVTGGVGRIRPYASGGERYNIAAIGTSGDHRGLLKSLDEEGGWQGAVYAVPFRTRISIKDLNVRLSNTEVAVDPIDFDGGQQMVLTFTARADRDGELRFNVKHASGGFLPGYDQVVEVSNQPRTYRFVLRSQLPAQRLSPTVVFSGRGVRITDVHAQLETEEVARPHLDQHEGTPHRGGVTFDLLPDPL